MTTLRLHVRESRPAADTRCPPPGDALLDLPESPLKDDRGTLVFPWSADGGPRTIVKVYGHMGVLNWARKQVVGYRARREFHTLASLRDADVACCEPLFWGTGRSPALGLFEAVATREVASTITAAAAAPTLTRERRAELVAQVFDQMRRIHAAGVYHGAPYLSNVLVHTDAAGTLVVTMLDFEKSIDFGRDIRGTRMAAFDLVNLINSTFAAFGLGYARPGLAHYGMETAAMHRLFTFVQSFQSSKFQRYRRRAEFLARGVLSRRFRRWRATPVSPLALPSRDHRPGATGVAR